MTSAKFGKVGFYAVDGLVDAQPFYASSVAVPGNGTHNILIVATEHDSVYAFDVESGNVSGRLLHCSRASHLRHQRLHSGHPGDRHHLDSCHRPLSWDEWRRVRGRDDARMRKNTYHQRVHALDLALRTELFGGADRSASEISRPGRQLRRGGCDTPRNTRSEPMLLMNGVLYTSWTSHCDARPYTGWIIAYNADTLAQSSVLNVTPNGSGGSIWMAGSGLAEHFRKHLFPRCQWGL